MSFINKILSEAFSDEIAKNFNYKRYNRDSDIDFEKLLKHYLPNAIFNSEAGDETDQALNKRFGKGWHSQFPLDEKLFEKYGKLENINLEKLVYFQPLVVKQGTMSASKPLQVIATNGKSILLNGYHRVAEALIAGITELKALVITT